MQTREEAEELVLKLRGVWTEDQQSAFVEFRLKGGATGNDLFFNNTNWSKDPSKGEFVLVDGLQRLTAVRKFLRNELKVFGHLLSEFEDREVFMRGFDRSLSFRINIHDLKTKAQVLGWYLEMNTGGTVHSESEIKRVTAMKQKEEQNGN